jgi:hypothetical protein
VTHPNLFFIQILIEMVQKLRQVRPVDCNVRVM